MPNALFNYVIIFSNTLPIFFRSKIGEKTFKNVHEFPVTNFGRHWQKIFTTNFVQDFLSVKANRERSSIFISFSCLFSNFCRNVHKIYKIDVTLLQKSLFAKILIWRNKINFVQSTSWGWNSTLHCSQCRKMNYMTKILKLQQHCKH